MQILLHKQQKYSATRIKKPDTAVVQVSVLLSRETMLNTDQNYIIKKSIFLELLVTSFIE
jgi:hypothetical protein